MNDETLMAERIGSLDEQLKAAKSKINKLEQERRHHNIATRIEEWVPAIVFTTLAIVAVGGGIGYPIYKAAMTPTAVDHCYLDTHRDGDDKLVVRLFGNVEWGPDRTLGLLDTPDQAVELAGKLGCPLLRGSE